MHERLVCQLIRSIFMAMGYALSIQLASFCQLVRSAALSIFFFLVPFLFDVIFGSMLVIIHLLIVFHGTSLTVHLLCIGLVGTEDNESI